MTRVSNIHRTAVIGTEISSSKEKAENAEATRKAAQNERQYRQFIKYSNGVPE